MRALFELVCCLSCEILEVVSALRYKFDGDEARGLCGHGVFTMIRYP